MTRHDLKNSRGDRKAPLHWIPMWALYGVARVVAYGARKYATGNWVTAAGDGEEALEDYMSASERHWADIQKAGMDKWKDYNPVSAEGLRPDWTAIDAESGLPHIDHLICSLIMLRGMAIQAGILPQDPGRGNDPPGKAPRAPVTD